MTWHYMTWHYITWHDMTLHYIIWHDVTWHYITLHYITLHYIILPYITLYYITLHTYIEWITWYGFTHAMFQISGAFRWKNLQLQWWGSSAGHLTNNCTIHRIYAWEQAFPESFLRAPDFFPFRLSPLVNICFCDQWSSGYFSLS